MSIICERKRNVRLSYVELAIVLIALSVLSTQVVAKFTRATEESNTCDLVEGLQKMRTQLTLYRVLHGGNWPPSDSFESFKAAMTSTEGRPETFVRKIPINPCNGLNTIRFDGDPAGTNEAGWRFDTKTGSLQADNSDGYAAL